MPSGFKTYSASIQVDLDDILKPIGVSTPRNNVGFKVGGTDISQRYKAYTTDPSKLPFNTFFKSGSVDLGQLFMSYNFIEGVYYILTVYSGSGGGSKESASLAPITASAAPSHYSFDTWIGSGITSPTSAQTTVLMDADKVVSASYDLNQYTLVVTNGTGDGTQDYGYTYNIVADAAPSHKHFTLWTSGQSPTFVNGTTSANSTADIQISQNTTITSNYDWNTYVLTVTYGSGDGTYAYNANMSITADAAPTYQHFATWINPVGSLSFTNAAASSTTANFTADGNATAEATYAWNDYTITVSGDAGIDYTSPAIGSDTYQYPDFPVYVTAVPKYDYDFVRWTLDGSNVGSSNPYSITAVANHTIAAVTSLKNVAFTITNDGHGSATTGTSSPCPIHTIITLTAYPNTGYSFSYYSANNSGVVSGNTVQLQGVGTTTITANFAINQYTLTVIYGSGGGSANYGNIYNIVAGTYTGYTFTNWQTNAGSISYGDANDPTTTATIGAANATTEAVYSANPYTLTVVDGTGGGTANYADPNGHVYTITADDYEPDYSFTNWTGAGITFANASSITTTCYMGATNATATANYIQN